MRAIANKNLLIRAAFLVLTICATVVWLNYWTATWSQTYLPLIGIGSAVCGLLMIVWEEKHRLATVIVVLFGIGIGQWWFLEPWVLFLLFSVTGFV